MTLRGVSQDAQCWRSQWNSDVLKTFLGGRGGGGLAPPRTILEHNGLSTNCIKQREGAGLSERILSEQDFGLLPAELPLGFCLRTSEEPVIVWGKSSNADQVQSSCHNPRPHVARCPKQLPLAQRYLERGIPLPRALPKPPWATVSAPCYTGISPPQVAGRGASPARSGCPPGGGHACPSVWEKDLGSDGAGEDEAAAACCS